MPTSAPVEKATPPRDGKQRVLVEFSADLLARADEVAREMNISRSELIRSSLEKRLQEIEIKRFEQTLAEAYLANADRNLALIEEFKHVDGEAF